MARILAVWTHRKLEQVWRWWGGELPRWLSGKRIHLPMQETQVWSLGRETPGGGNDNPFQYSCLENPMDTGAWRATVQGFTKSQTQLSTHTRTHVQVGELRPGREIPGVWSLLQGYRAVLNSCPGLSLPNTVVRNHMGLWCTCCVSSLNGGVIWV